MLAMMQYIWFLKCVLSVWCDGWCHHHTVTGNFWGLHLKNKQLNLQKPGICSAKNQKHMHQADFAVVCIWLLRNKVHVYGSLCHSIKENFCDYWEHWQKIQVTNSSGSFQTAVLAASNPNPFNFNHYGKSTKISVANILKIIYFQMM